MRAVSLLAVFPPGDHHDVMSARPPSRRDLLRPLRAAVDANSMRSVPQEVESSGALLMEIGRPAMGCRFEVLLHADAAEAGVEAAIAALDRVEFLEQQLTLYRPTSDLCRLNRTAAHRDTPVDDDLWRLIDYAARLHAETGGAFDITTTPLSRCWGFHHREGRLPDPHAIRDAMERVGMQHVRLDAETQSVRFLRPGIELSFAALGKGYALDAAADLLEAAPLDDFVIHGGYSSILARGSPPARSESMAPGWRIALRDPFRPERRLGRIILHNAAVGTSGLANQSFIHRGKRYGHLLDPRTGYPADDLLSVTVVAPTALEADALSTALFVLGREAAGDWCARRSDVGAVLVSPGTASNEPVVEPIGLDDQWLPDMQ